MPKVHFPAPEPTEEEGNKSTAEYQRQYREQNPEKVAEWRKISTITAKERYRTDPEYRERVKKYQREYKARRTAEKRKQAENG